MSPRLPPADAAMASSKSGHSGPSEPGSESNRLEALLPTPSGESWD